MSGKPITRRHALFLSGATIAGLSVPGCDKATQQAIREIVKLLPWARAIITTLSVIVDLVGLVLKVSAIVNGKPETLEITLTQQEVETLRSGGKVVIQSSDGKNLDYSSGSQGSSTTGQTSRPRQPSRPADGATINFKWPTDIPSLDDFTTQDGLKFAWHSGVRIRIAANTDTVWQYKYNADGILFLTCDTYTSAGIAYYIEVR